MTKKKGRPKGGGPGGDHGVDDDDASTDEDPSTSALADHSNEGLQGSCEKAQATSPRCPHVGKAVNVSAIKKALKAAWIPMGRCGACAKDRRIANQAPLPGKKGQTRGSGKAAATTSLKAKSGNVNASSLAKLDPNVPSSIWLCLRCGVQSCRPKTNSLSSDTKGGHALAHFKVPRSDLHCVCVNVTSPSPNATGGSEEDASRWDIFCFECNTNLYLDSYKKLHEAVEFVRRLSEGKNQSVPVASSKAPLKGQVVVGKKGAVANASVGSGTDTTSLAKDGTISRSRGLANLGNTCFFNAVMQCLTQSHPLTHLLLTHTYCQEGTPFETPAVPMEFTISNSRGQSPFEYEGRTISGKQNILDAMTLTLNEAGNMTQSIAAFFAEMANLAAKGVVNPGHLFGQVSMMASNFYAMLCTRSPQFRGMQQQDAHELLRHLIEGLRVEEVKRQKQSILRFFGLTEKTDPKTVSSETRKKLQALKIHSNYTIVDKIFGGHLVSTVVCEVCHNSSQIYEPFLDLSLPLTEERNHPPTPKQKQSSKYGKQFLGTEAPETCDSGLFERSSMNTVPNKKDFEKKSKHQLKKEKERQRKEQRKNKKYNKKRKPSGTDQLNESSTINDVKKDDLQDNGKENVKNEQTDEQKGPRQDVEVVVESATDNNEEGDKSCTALEEPEKRLQLRTTSRTPLSTDEKQNRSRSVSPNISERIRELSRDASPIPSGGGKSDSGGRPDSSPSTKAKMLTINNISKNMQKFQSKDSSKTKRSEGKVSRGGSEEDDEGDAYIEDGEDWEWDYDEGVKQVAEDCAEKSDVAEAGSGSPGSDPNNTDEQIILEHPKLVSLNPLPPESLLPSDQERSSVEPGEEGDEDHCHEDSEATTGASSNADVEDNIDPDVGHNSANASSNSNPVGIVHRLYSVESSASELTTSPSNSLLDKPFQPDPDHLDPHMEELCRNIRKLSIKSCLQGSSILIDTIINNEDKNEIGEGDAENSATNSSAYQTATGAIGSVNSGTGPVDATPQKLNGNNNKIKDDRVADEERHQIQLQNEWVTRSLTSIAPRYRTTPGECSVYSCLTHFTAPELLTGNNKWACEKCTKLKQAEKLARREENKNQQQCNNYTSDTSTDTNQNINDTEKDSNSRRTTKDETVYSNASKQLLVFCPPAVLTIHLKRFEQTVVNLRKACKHVQFPIVLDLAPFCSSTSISMANVPAGVKEIKYYLFGVVEHSGRLQGGHYTAYVNTRSSQASNFNDKLSSLESTNYYSRFYSTPNSKNGNIEGLFKDIEIKSRLITGQQATQELSTHAVAKEGLGDIKTAAASTAFGEKENKALSTDDTNSTGATRSDNSDNNPPHSIWYHISDSNVTEVAQEKVLKCQAYILLYERIK